MLHCRGPEGGARTSAGPCGLRREHKPPFVLRHRGRRGLGSLQLSPLWPLRVHCPACPHLLGSSRAAALGLRAPDLPAPRFTPEKAGEGEGGGGGGGRHVTRLATFQHSHRIDNFSAPPAPQSRHRKPTSVPQFPPHTPANFLCYGDSTERHPFPENRRGSREEQGQGRSTFWADLGGVPWGSSPGPAAQVHPAQLFTSAARPAEARQDQRNPNELGADPEALVAVVYAPQPRATFLIRRDFSLQSMIFFFFFQSKKNKTAA